MKTPKKSDLRRAEEKSAKKGAEKDTSALKDTKTKDSKVKYAKSKDAKDSSKSSSSKSSKDPLAELKSKLKNFEDLKNEYAFLEENLTSKIILKFMSETLEGHIKLLIQLLQPEEFHSLHECTVFDDNDKTKIFDLYKNMMIMHREILKADIQNDENNNIATINLVDAELRLLKPQMINIVQKMQSSWKAAAPTGTIARYFG